VAGAGLRRVGAEQEHRGTLLAAELLDVGARKKPIREIPARAIATNQSTPLLLRPVL
jgi:hypothetical protein